MSTSGFPLNDKKSRFSLFVKQRFENTSSRPVVTEEYPKIEGSYRISTRSNLSCSSRRRTTSTRSTTSSWTIIVTKLGSSWSSWEKSQWNERIEAISFDTIARRKLIEDRAPILELTGKIQELQNEVDCMNDSRDFKDAESVRSGQSYVASQLVSFPPHPDPGGMQRHSLGMLSRKDGPPSILGHTWYIEKHFCRSSYKLHEIHLVERKATWWVHMVRGETYKKKEYFSSWRHMTRYADAYVRCSQKEGKTKMGQREIKTRQVQTVERNFLDRTRRWRVQAHNQSRLKKVGSSDASSDALQSTNKKQWRDPLQYWET